MKYISVFLTILLIWVAAILIAFTRSDANEIFELYVVVMFSTIVLFLIGFSKK